MAVTQLQSRPRPRTSFLALSPGRQRRAATASILVIGVMAAGLLPLRAQEPDAAPIAIPGEGWFQQALALDLGTDSAPDATRAFAAMRRAAEAGHPEAAFNVAAMLDSGRGTPRNVIEAALWYARAAARGNARAAYNLGQLYESGDGVPANADLAHAWYAASGLPAARERLKRPVSTAQRSSKLEAPQPIFPKAETVLAGQVPTLELVWTSNSPAASVRFFVELRQLDDVDSRETWTGFTDVTAVSIALPGGVDHLAWRVSAVARNPSLYATSNWSVISISSVSAFAESRTGIDQH